MANRNRDKQVHDHPGGSGAVLGVRVMRNTSVQGIALVVGNAVQLVSILVVAAFLGPDEMARYALLLFLAGLTTQLLSLLVKPGTIRRVFGGGDDEDDDDDDDVVSASPARTLGTGLAWALVLGAAGTLAIYLLRRPIADGLLGDPDAENLVVWAGVLAGVWLVFKIADITLWLERRSGSFLIADTARPLLGLIALVAFLAGGAGVEGAIVGTAIGTGLAGVVGLVLLRGSYEPSLDFGEVKQIIIRGGYRAPIVMSFWLVQNADIFILSRFVDHTELGIYSLASRLGFVVSFLPQGFRMAMRPLRKSAIFDAFKDQYGKQTAQGQLLAYFTLICILAVLLMVLCGQVLVDAAPDAYADAAPLIPFTAVAFVMPALYRTVNQNVNIPNKRPWFVGGVVAAALMFIAIAALLAEPIGVYAAPVGMIVAFVIPVTILYVRGQRGGNPLHFPYREVLTALALAVGIAAGFELLPEMSPLIQLPLALALVCLWMVLLVPLRAIPQQHWRPLIHMVRSFRRGTPATFRPRRGLRALEPGERDELRAAVIGRLPRERLVPEAGDEGLRLVRSLRRVGKRGGIPLRRETPHDEALALALFEDASTAVRNASGRRVLADGADSNDLRALEDLVSHLAKVPPDAWEGRKAAETRAERRGARLRKALRSGA